MEKRYFLGIDGGASNIGVSVLDAEGNQVVEFNYPHGANYHALGLDAAVGNLQQAIMEATSEIGATIKVFDRAVFGLAGCNFPTDAQILTDSLRKSSLNSLVSQGFDVVNDSHIALWAAVPNGVGVVLIAGTGSNCFGRNASGQEAKSGGLDYILSDEGSGYDIGMRMLRAVARSLDRRGDQTELTDAIFNLLEVSSLADFYNAVYQKYTIKPQIASLSEIVGGAAQHGDLVAIEILNHSVNELLKLVDAVLDQLSWHDQQVPVARVGSVFHSQYVADRFGQELKRVAPNATIIVPQVPAAVGAARMAKQTFEE